MVLLGWGENGEALKWGGGMLAWEKEHVRECSDILINIVLQPWQMALASTRYDEIYYYKCLPHVFVGQKLGSGSHKLNLE